MSWLQFHTWKWGFWLHIFGRGIHVSRDRMVLFSERYGYKRVYRLGRWSFEWQTIRSLR